jgi:hypothetical protein
MPTKESEKSKNEKEKEVIPNLHPSGTADHLDVNHPDVGHAAGHHRQGGRPAPSPRHPAPRRPDPIPRRPARIVPPRTALSLHRAAPSCPSPHCLAPEARLPKPPESRRPTPPKVSRHGRRPKLIAYRLGMG